MRGPAIDRNLVMVSLGLMLFGLATLYSAGQTDVPTRAAGVWHRQFVWFGVGIVACWRHLQRLAPGARVAGPRALRLQHPAAGSGADGGHRCRHRREQPQLALHRRPSDRAALRAGQGRHRAHAGALPLQPERGAPVAPGSDRSGADRRGAVPAGPEAARPGQRPRVRRHLLRHAVLVRRPPPAAVPHGDPRHQPAARLQHAGLERAGSSSSC